MTRRPSKLQVLVPAAMFVTLAACQAKKSENPLSPSVAGPIPGVQISAPRLLEPAQGFKFKENQQPIRLVVENAVTTGVRPLWYGFEIASDPGFANKVFARGSVPQGDGRTSVQVDALELGRPYYWRAWADDGANVSATLTAGFEMLPRVVFTPPTPASPVDNTAVADRRPTLRINNSSHNSAVGAVSYFFVVAKDQTFTQIAATGIVAEGAVTQWTVDRDLDYGLTHFWRVRGTDGENTTDWSPTAVFKAPAAPAPAPGGGGGGGGGIPPGAPCNSPDPLKIVECERAKYGHMSHSQMLEFAKATVRSLNRNGISGGPFGILTKTGGTNCGGYSCDVICAGEGGNQRQWDILGDIEGDQWPGWGGPNGPGGIRTDSCTVLR
jgi:hypothetical protein